MIQKSVRILGKVKLGKGIKVDDFVIIGAVAKEEKVRNTVIGDNAHIRSHTVIYEGNKIGNDFITGHGVLIRENNEIGDNVSIGSHSVVEHNVKIGNNVRIHSSSFIPEFSILEDDSWIGPLVIFTNTMHPACPMAKKCRKGPIVKKKAKICAGSILMPDITIGENSLVGAGSVVTKDVPRGVVVIGQPAKVYKKVKDLRCPYGFIDKPY